MKTQKTKKRRIKFILFFALIDFALGYLYFSASNLILEAGGQIFQTSVSNCSYYAIEQCIDEKFAFDSVCKIQTDTNGNITLITTDTLLLNYLVKELSLDCYNYMNEVMQSGFSLPAGVFTGIKPLSGLGPKVNLKLATALSVECRILRTFEQAGINQTRQVLSALIYTEIYVFAPFNKQKFDGTIEIVVYDNFIVGKVPECYLDTSVLASGTTKK